MSYDIESRVVEMRFDNKHFEQNASNTMSTLDKLKAKLNFSGASKGLENVGAAAKNVNMSSLGNAVETVSARFSAMDVIGVTALANITNSAVNAGKRMLSALTIDPIKTGFQEYETQINAVQTILANTSSKGTTIDEVNEALEQLNAYADMTIYNFTEMTRNIGTFTAAGVDLDTSVAAIQGIANLAAVSGSTSQQASTAMYQLSQALATGTVKLQDWNSVVNAGMGGEVFQNALIRTAAAMDGAADNVEAWRAANIDSFGSFRDSLTQGGWLTTEVLTQTLNQFTMAAEEGSETWTEYKKVLMESGYTAKQAEEILKMANTATDAATKVKTFTQLWDVMKESAQSGWSQTWKLLVGDFEQAKAILTPLADFMTTVIGKISDFRNDILESALTRKFTSVIDGVTAAIKVVVSPAAKAAEAVQKTVHSLEELNEIADKVIRGDFGNGADRLNALTEAGINYYAVQNKVNEKLGDSFRHSEDVVNSQYELLGMQSKVTESAEENADAMVELNEEQIKNIAYWADLSDASLRALGFSETQIAAFRELNNLADQLGLSVEDLLRNMDDIDGRWLMIESFKNIGNALIDIFTVLKDAWTDAFPVKPIEEYGQALFNALAAVHRFSVGFRDMLIDGDNYTATGEKLLRTLKGIFAIIDIIATVVGGVFKVAFKVAFKVITEVLGRFGLSLLDVTAAIGDAIVGFRDWMDAVINSSGVIEFLVTVVMMAVSFISDLINTVKNSDEFKAFCGYVKTAADNLKVFFSSISGLESFQRLVDVLSNAGTAIREWINSLKGSDNIPRDIIAGLVNGIRDGAPRVISALFDLARDIITGICEALGIHSPSTEMMKVGKYTVDGLILGIKEKTGPLQDIINSIVATIVGLFKTTDFGPYLTAAFDTVVQFGAKILNWVKTLDIGSILTIAFGAGMFSLAKNILGVVKTIAAPLNKIGKMCEAIGEGMNKALTSLSGTFDAAAKNLKADTWEKRGRAILSFALALAVLVASVVVLTMIPAEKLWPAIGAIAALAAVVAVLAIAIGKLGPTEGAELGKFTMVLLGISGSILLVAFALKQLSSIDSTDMLVGINGLVSVVGAMILVMAAVKLFGKSADKAGATLIKMSIAMLLMVTVMKLAGGINEGVARRGIETILVFGGFITALLVITNLAGRRVDKVGSTLIKMAVAMALMVGVVKLAAGLDPRTLADATPAILAFIGIIASLMLVTRLFGGNVKRLGSTLLSMSVAMLLMTIVVKMLANMPESNLKKGLKAVAMFGLIIVALVASTKLVGPSDLKRVATTILSMSIAIGIMALIAALLGVLKIEHLIKGVTAVTILGLMLTAMIWATRGASDCSKNIMMMTVAIGVMAIAVAALALIDTNKLMTASAALSMTMAMFALMIKSAAGLNASKGVMAPLIVMTVAIGVMAGALYVLATLPIESAMASAASLSVLLLALTVALSVVSKAGSTSVMALVAIGTIALVVAGLATILWFIKDMPVESTIANALSLSGLLLVMAGVCAIVSLIPAKAALSGALGLSAFALVMAGLLAILGGLYRIEGVNDLLSDGGELLSTIGYAIGSFVGSIVGGLAAGVTSGLPEIATNLSNFMTNITPFIEGIRTLDMSVLAGAGILAGAIMAITAADFLAGIASFVTGEGSFAQLGYELSLFMINAMPFIAGASMLNEDMLAGVKALAEAILILTGANIIDSLTTFLTGGSSLSDFGAQLPGLGSNLSAFVTNLGAFDENAVTTATCAANVIKTLAQAAAEIPNSGGLLGALVGENDLGTFAAQFPLLASGIRLFLTNLGAFSEDQVTTVTCAANAVKMLAQAASEIPNMGGILASIVGDNDLATFASQFPLLGTGLKLFLMRIGTFTEEEETTVTCAANAVKTLASAAKEIPNMGGLLATLVGDNSLETFATQFPSLGLGLRGFLDNIGTFTEDQVATVTCAANAVKVLAQAAQGIDGQSEWAKKIFGDNGIATFSTQFGTLGTNLNTFVTNLGTFTEGQVSTVQSAVAAIKAFAALADSDLSGAKKNLSGFGDNLGSFGTDVKTFISNMPSSESITSAVTGVNKIIRAVENIADCDSGVLSTFANNLKKLGDGAVDKFIGAFTSSTAKTDMKTAATNLADSAIDGIESKENAAKTAGENLADKAIDGLGDLEDDGETAGKDLGKGLVNGINAKQTAAYNAGYALGQAAVQGEKDGQASNSPSKLTTLAGRWLGEGLIIGIKRITGKVYDSGYDLGSTATDAISSTVSRLADVVGSDIDAQPTISPVLDLSNVRTGAAAINDMLGMGSTVGVLANANGINAMLNQNRQNGGNSEIVSAIADLRKDLGKVGNTSYNINGVTYDDGSNISDAVRTIVRAARTERRV